MMATHQFTSGDGVVYPGHGVGTVVGVKSETIGGSAMEFLVVTFMVGMTLRIPVANVKKCGLRKLSSRRAMQEALSVLREPRAHKKPMWRHRALEYAAKIKSGEARSIAEIVRDLHRGPGQSEASFSEKTVYQQAWDHLIPEVAAADNTDTDTAAKKVLGLLEAA